MQPNLNFSRLGENYLFSEVRARTRAFCEAHPGVRVTDLGVGDVTLPLAAPVVRALRAACAEMGRRETFRGYGPAEGYAFLREALAARYARLGARISPEDIFVSDGAKSDLTAILALFSPHNTVLVPSPGYPVYVDTNLVCGRQVHTLAATRENGFLPLPGPGTQAGVVYLCSPGNPTGAAYSADGLAAWVRWALGSGALLVFDAAYEAFIQDKALPHSIYQIEGARECAIEIGSFSKSAGFTGLRCGWAVVPQALRAGGVPLRGLYARWRAISTNGVAYPVQRAAAAALSCEGRAAVAKNIQAYRKNAQVLAAALQQAGVWYCGGKNSPYLWLEAPRGMGSWALFEHLLHTARVSGTPGVGFGPGGEGYFRLSAFGDAEATRRAAARLCLSLGMLAGK